MAHNNIFFRVLLLEKVFLNGLIEGVFGGNEGSWVVRAFNDWIESSIPLGKTIEDSFSQNISFQLGFEIEARKFFGRHSVVFVEREYFDEELFCHFGEFSFFEDFGDVFGLDFFDELFLGFRSPRSVSGKHLKENDSNGPEVGFEGVLIFFEGLGGHVERGAYIVLAGLEEFFGFDSEAEVSDFEGFGVSYQEVSRFEVSVYDLVLVDFLVSLEELGHVEVGFGFCEFGLDDLVHVWGAEFGNQVSVIFSGEDIEKCEDVGFAFEFFEDIDFGLEQYAIDFVFEHFEVDDFHSDWDLYR